MASLFCMAQETAITPPPLGEINALSRLQCRPDVLSEYTRHDRIDDRLNVAPHFGYSESGIAIQVSSKLAVDFGPSSKDGRKRNLECLYRDFSLTNSTDAYHPDPGPNAL